MCEHLNFESTTRIGRLSDVENGPITGYCADVSIKCRDCGHPFTWVGVPFGYSKTHPMASVNGQELRAPIMPSDFSLERIMNKDQ